MVVISGSIESIDHARRVISMGRTELWVPQHISLASLAVGMSVTVTCEVRAGGQHWVVDLKENRF